MRQILWVISWRVRSDTTSDNFFFWTGTTSNNWKQVAGTRFSVFKPAVHGPFLVSEETLLGRLVGPKFWPQPFRLLWPNGENVFGGPMPIQPFFSSYSTSYLTQNLLGRPASMAWLGSCPRHATAHGSCPGDLVSITSWPGSLRTWARVCLFSSMMEEIPVSVPSKKRDQSIIIGLDKKLMAR